MGGGVEDLLERAIWIVTPAYRQYELGLAKAERDAPPGPYADTATITSAGQIPATWTPCKTPDRLVLLQWWNVEVFDSAVVLCNRQSSCERGRRVRYLHGCGR